MKIIVIIPAYNEEATIDKVIQEVKMNNGIDIVVINDGSKDRTSEIARKTGAFVIDFPKNRGIGKAIKAGYQYSIDHDYDIAIQVDADGQHNPAVLPRLISKIRDEGYDMVIGSRFVIETSYKSSKYRYLGIKYFSFLINLLHGVDIKDPTSGYRAVNKRVMQHSLMCYLDDYPEVPVLSDLLYNHYRICEVPVEMRKRQSGKSSITLADSLVYFFKVTYVCIKGLISNEDKK